MKPKQKIPYTFSMNFNNGTFNYRNRNITYYTKGAGKPLIILHGWGSESKVMMPLAESMAELRECHLIDFPGFGDSDEPEEPWGIEDYADMVKAYIDQKTGEANVDFLVHSFGCRVILLLCSENGISERIDKVLITGGAGLKPKRSFNFYLRKYTAKTLKLPFMILPESLREKGLKKLRNTSLWKKLGSSDYQKLTGVMRETFVKSVTKYMDDLLPEIDHEILLLWGEKDDATPIDQAKRLEKGLKNSALVTIEGAGHYAFLEQSARFTAITKAFFEG